MTGAELIAAERKRQVEAEGWTPEMDDRHDRGELAWAAACYAAREHIFIERRRSFDGYNKLPIISMESPWPFDERWWKPSEDRIANLVRAGALIAAEIDRLQRAAGGE